MKKKATKDNCFWKHHTYGACNKCGNVNWSFWLPQRNMQPFSKIQVPMWFRAMVFSLSGSGTYVWPPNCNVGLSKVRGWSQCAQKQSLWYMSGHMQKTNLFIRPGSPAENVLFFQAYKAIVYACKSPAASFCMFMHNKTKYIWKLFFN